MDCTVSDTVRPFSGPAFHFVTSGAGPKVHSSTGHKERERGGGIGGRGEGTMVVTTVTVVDVELIRRVYFKIERGWEFVTSDMKH